MILFLVSLIDTILDPSRDSLLVLFCAHPHLSEVRSPKVRRFAPRKKKKEIPLICVGLLGPWKLRKDCPPQKKKKKAEMVSLLSFWSGLKQRLPSSGRGGTDDLCVAVKAIIASMCSECVIKHYLYMKSKRRGGRSGRKGGDRKRLLVTGPRVKWSLSGGCFSIRTHISLIGLGLLTLTVNRPSQDDSPPGKIGQRGCTADRCHTGRCPLLPRLVLVMELENQPREKRSVPLIRRLRRQPMNHAWNDSQSFWHFRYTWNLFTWAFQLS